MGVKTLDRQKLWDSMSNTEIMISRAAAGLPRLAWVPLRSHWTVTGAECRAEDRKVYAAYPSQYK